MKEDEFNEQQETLVAQGMDPKAAKAQVDRMRIDWFAGNKLVNEGWQNTLNGIAGRATTDTLLQKGEVSEYMKQSVALYRQLKSVNPAYLSTLLSDKPSREFLEAYDTAVTHRRMPEDEALLYAAQWTAKPEAEKSRTLLPYDKADKLATNTLSSLGLDSRNANYSYAMGRIEEMSRNGATDKEIKANLEKEILETSVPINGVLVFANNDLPDDFPDLMQGEIDKRFKDLGAKYGIADSSDLYVASDGSESKWYVMSKSLRMPIGTAPITSQSLEGVRSERRKAHEAEVRKMAEAKDAERADYKRKYDAQIAGERERIQYWRDQATKRKGTGKSLAGFMAEKLQSNLDERLARDRGEFDAKRKELELGVKKSMEKDRAASQKRIDWLRSLVPEVTVGNTKVIDGWNVNR